MPVHYSYSIKYYPCKVNIGVECIQKTFIMDRNVNPDNCPLCKEKMEIKAHIGIVQKGANGINKASEQRGDDIVVEAGDRVHEKCRKVYTNPKEIERFLNKKKAPFKDKKRTTRDHTGTFDSKTDCLFCGIKVTENSKYYCVRTKIFTSSILDCCEVRSDSWSMTVKGGLEYCGRDVMASECLYHHLCCGHFRSLPDIPQQFQIGPPDARCK